MTGQFVEIGGIRVDVSQFDFSDTSSKVNDVRTANIVLISLVVLTVTLRLVARTRFVRRIFADDGEWFSIVFLHVLTSQSLHRNRRCVYVSPCSNVYRWYVLSISRIGRQLTHTVATGSGLGTHIWLLPMATVSKQMKSCILVRFECSNTVKCLISIVSPRLPGLVCLCHRFDEACHHLVLSALHTRQDLSAHHVRDSVRHFCPPNLWHLRAPIPMQSCFRGMEL
jgi:hypothetical protein